MGKKLSEQEFKELVQKMMLQELKSKPLKEFDDEDEDNLGIYSGDFNIDDFEGAAQNAAMQDIGSDFVPLGKSQFEKNMDPEEFKADLKRQNLKLPNDKKELDNIAKMMNKKNAHEKKFGAGSLNETGDWSDEFEEGPQPGDLEYHYEEPVVHKGIGSFNDIDWQVLYETLIYNEEYVKTGKVKDAPNYIGANIRDIIDGFGMSKEELKLLEDYDVISLGTFPELANDSLKDYNTFFTAAKEAWEKGPIVYNDNSDETPYMRGAEGHDLIGEDEETMTFDFDTKSLYSFLKDAMYIFKEGSASHYNYAEAAKVLEEELLKEFKIAKRIFYEGNVNLDSKIDRPKDAEGQPITLKSRVKDVETKNIGHVVRFGVDDNGKQTVHVHWFGIVPQTLPKSITYPEKIVVRDENRIVRETEIEESSIRSHANGKGQNKKPGNFPQTLKRVGLKENLDQAVSTDDEVFLVIDNNFNRSHYPDLIGKTFSDAPAYAQVKVISPESVEVEKAIKYDDNEEVSQPVQENEFNRAELQHHGEQELADLDAEAKKYVPQNLQQYLEQYSFEMGNVDADTGSFEYSYKLRVKKQADETLQAFESWLKEEADGDLNSMTAAGPGKPYRVINLFTVLEKGTGDWIVSVHVRGGFDI